MFVLSVRDLICDVISCSVCSRDMNKIKVYDKIVIENEHKREYEIEQFVYMNLHLKRGL